MEASGPTEIRTQILLGANEALFQLELQALGLTRLDSNQDDLLNREAACR